MSCKEMEAKLVSYTDGRASETERRAVESHLETCAGCRARVAEYRSLWGVLDEAPALEPSPSFDARLRQRIAAEPRRGWWARLLLSGEGALSRTPRLALAAVMLVLLAVWVTIRPADIIPTQPKTADGGGIAAMNDETTRDLQVLEDYDVLADFDALSALPPAASKKEM